MQTTVSRARMSRGEIERRVADLGPWFHNLDLDGVPTAPEHFLGDYPRLKFRAFADALPSDMRGKSVLDVGCNAGFYSFEMKRRGARKVVGIDSDPRYLAQARFAAEVTGLDVELRELSVYEVGALGEKFDLVIFMGVLYHLRHPLLALDLLHEHVVGDTMLFQSLQRGSSDVLPLAEDYPFRETDVFDDPRYPKLHFVEKKYSRDQTNWWIPNRACVEAMLRSTGFEISQHPEQEVYLCRHARRERQSGEWEVHRSVRVPGGAT
ncbi:MAG: TIGR04290 family methyltransferase [Myxococcota bacterium]|nr:TIGR04290 family methyltransferase [Myxococcota bacterium]